MERRIGTIDTNIILRLILNDNEDHHGRSQFLVTAPCTYLTVLDQAIIECVYYLGQKKLNYTRSAIRDLLLSVLVEPRLDYNEALFQKVFDLYVSHPKLSFTDCYMVCKTEELERTPFYTFDEKLTKQFPSAKLVP